jgi:DNA-binding transcriptional ArsR family regulator
VVNPILIAPRRPGEIREADTVGYLLSDLAVLQAVQSRYVRRALATEPLRAVRLVALAAFVRACESELGGHRAPWTVEFPLDPEPLARSLGLQSSQVDAALGHLREAGVLVQVRSGASIWYRLDEAVFERGTAADEIDWPAVFTRLQGEPAALLVARAFVDLLPQPFDNWASVRLSALAEHTGYGNITTRKGKDALVQASILEEEAQIGHTSRYRFSAFARGLTPSPPRSDPAAAVVVAEREAGAQAAEVSPDLSSKATIPTSGTVPVQVAGLRLDLPPGISIRLEVTADGRQVVRIGSHLVVGPF